MPCWPYRRRQKRSLSTSLRTPTCSPCMPGASPSSPRTCSWPGGSAASRKGWAEQPPRVTPGTLSGAGTRSVESGMLPGLAISEPSVHVGFVMFFFVVVVFKNFVALLCNKVMYKKINMVPEA